MEKSKKIWMDGKFVDWDKAQIHVLTHSLHYGGAVFEGMRFYQTDRGTVIFRIKDHIDRLFHSAKQIKLELKYSKNDLTKATVDLVRINKLKQGYIRPIIYFGYGKMGLSPNGSPTNVAIAAWNWGSYLGNDTVNAKISDFIRIHPKSTSSEAKITGSYYNSILASLDVRSKGYDEAILLDFKGNIAEGPGENIFIVKNKVLITPAPGNILSGITRKSILEIAKNLGIKNKIQTVTKSALLNADEAFFSGTAAEISPIKSINDRRIGKTTPGPITKILKNAFNQVVKGELPQYSKWLTIIE